MLRDGGHQEEDDEAASKFGAVPVGRGGSLSSSSHGNTARTMKKAELNF